MYQYTFSPNTKIRSSEVNANNAAIWPLDWTDYSPTFGGTGSNPTFIYFRYMQIGKLCTVSWRGNANGTIDAGGGLVTMTLPIAPKYAQTWWDLQTIYSTSRQISSGTVSAGDTTMIIGQIAWDGADASSYTIENNYGANLAWGFAGCGNTLTYEVV